MMAETMTGTAERPHTRPPRRTRVGVVASDKGDKTIKVTAIYTQRHLKYGKYMRRRTTMHAHDEKNEARVGDTVELMECRPVSKTKCWRLVRIVNRSAS